MSKQSRFKVRAQQRGQDVAVYSFLNWPTGAYLDAWSGTPDPDDASYPASQPEASYADAVTVKGFFQPVSVTKEEKMVLAPWGEEVLIAATVKLPGDQAIAHRDKVVVSSLTYYVAAIAPWLEGNETVYTEVLLTESVPRAS